MQPDDNRSFQEAPTSDTERGPVVTLSPDEEQPVYVGEPTSIQAQDAPTHVQTQDAPIGEQEPIRWQASEYVHNEKNHLWFLLFILSTLGLIGVALFVIKSRSFAILIPVMAAALFVYTRRPPQVLDYTLSRQGLHVNDRLHGFGEFKGFTLVHGLEQRYSILLIPTKRFKPAVTINFSEELGEQIVDMLAVRLPMSETQPDIIDKIINKLHL